MRKGSRVGLIGLALILAGIWVLALSVAAATATAYPEGYRQTYYLAASGLALICSGGVVAGFCDQAG